MGVCNKFSVPEVQGWGIEKRDKAQIEPKIS